MTEWKVYRVRISGSYIAGGYTAEEAVNGALLGMIADVAASLAKRYSLENLKDVVDIVVEEVGKND